MSVANCLGLTEASELLVQANDSWPTWCPQHPELDVVTDTTTLRAWLKQATTEAADEVLLGLAEP